MWAETRCANYDHLRDTIEKTIPEQCVATYFPEANVLIPFKRAACISNQPISKSVVIRIRPSAVS